MIKDRIILGIDPGTIVMGYGILKIEGNKPKLEAMGILQLNKYEDHYLRLRKIFERVLALIDQYHPDELAIEAPFFGKNVQSMLKLGRAQGVAMAAALERDIPIFEYAPLKIKLSITGNGNAAKEQVAGMLQRYLKIPDESMLPQLDATDGLAAARRDEIAVPEHKAQPFRRARGRGDVAVGQGIVHGAEGALFKQGVRSAEDKVDVPRDLAFAVILGAGAAGDQHAGAEEAVLLPLLFGQRRAEQGILIAQQLHAAKLRPRCIHIGGNGLPHSAAGARVVLDGQVFHRNALAAQKGRVAAEGMGGAAIRVGQPAAVTPDDAGAVGPGSPQGQAALFGKELLPVDAGADLDHGFAVVGHGQQRLGNGGKIARTVAGNSNVDHSVFS